MSDQSSVTSEPVEMLDADGKQIREGSVLRHAREETRGVVELIVKDEPKFSFTPLFAGIGDMVIHEGAGVQRITNRYRDWRHVPHAEQTYHERFRSWIHSTYHHEEFYDYSEDTGVAISGILALMPRDVVDCDYGPWPDSISGTLEILAQYLETLEGLREQLEQARAELLLVAELAADPPRRSRDWITAQAELVRDRILSEYEDDDEDDDEKEEARHE